MCGPRAKTERNAKSHPSLRNATRSSAKRQQHIPSQRCQLNIAVSLQAAEKLGMLDSLLKRFSTNWAPEGLCTPSTSLPRSIKSTPTKTRLALFLVPPSHRQQRHDLSRGFSARRRTPSSSSPCHEEEAQRPGGSTIALKRHPPFWGQITWN